jgi:hypothetical protein
LKAALELEGFGVLRSPGCGEFWETGRAEGHDSKSGRWLEVGWW